MLSLRNVAKTGQDTHGFTAMNYPEEKQLDVFLILYDLSSGYCTISLRITRAKLNISLRLQESILQARKPLSCWACVMPVDWLLDAKHLPEGE